MTWLINPSPPQSINLHFLPSQMDSEPTVTAKPSSSANAATTGPAPAPTTTTSLTNKASSDQAYPTAPPTRNGSTTSTAPTSNTAITRPQQYNINPPTYLSGRLRRKRGCCCSCIIWTTLITFILIISIGITGLVLYFVYRPKFPTFTITSIKMGQFNLTQFGTELNLSVTARNPNEKILLYYEPSRVSILSGDLDIGDGSFPAYEQGTKETTTLFAVVQSDGAYVTGGDVKRLRWEIREGNGLDMRMVMRTKVRLRVGDLRTVRFGIRVSCGGIRADGSNGKLDGEVVVRGGGKCKGKWRIKIWKVVLYI